MSKSRRLRRPAAAERLGVSIPTLDRKRKHGRGPRYYKVGNLIFYYEEDIDSYLEQCARETEVTERNAECVA